MSNIIKSKIVAFDNEYKEVISQIRTHVFVKEQDVDHDIDFDGRDKDAIHVLIFFQGKAIGTARMLSDGHIGRVAVLKEYRNKGAGYTAVKSLIEQAKTNGLKRVYLGSQVHASKFYEKMGFSTYGDEFIEANIRHIEMEYFL